MKVAVVGRGNVGGGLADKWERAGHDVTRLGKDGGDVSDADAVLFAVPGGAVADAVDSVQGIEGKTVLDATNLIGAEPPSGFASRMTLAEAGSVEARIITPALANSLGASTRNAPLE